MEEEKSEEELNKKEPNPQNGPDDFFTFKGFVGHSQNQSDHESSFGREQPSKREVNFDITLKYTKSIGSHGSRDTPRFRSQSINSRRVSDAEMKASISEDEIIEESAFRFEKNISETRSTKVDLVRFKDGRKAVMKQRYLNDKNSQRLFYEVFSLKKAQGIPGVMEFLEAFQNMAKYSILMEDCSGKSLIESIEKERRFSEQEVTKIMREILTIVSGLHSRSIVHGKINPHSLIYKEEKGAMNLKLVGFGNSYCSNENKPRSTISLTGDPLFFAPEVYSSNSYGVESDLWSCGKEPFLFFDSSCF